MIVVHSVAGPISPFGVRGFGGIGWIVRDDRGQTSTPAFASVAPGSGGGGCACP